MTGLLLARLHVSFNSSALAPWISSANPPAWPQQSHLQPPWVSASSSTRGATQSHQIPRCFCQEVRAHQSTKGGISRCAGATQGDISVSGMGRRAVYPLCTQQPPRWMAAGGMINESWDVQLSWWGKQTGLLHRLPGVYLQEKGPW